MVAWLAMLAGIAAPASAAETVSAADIPSVATALAAAGYTAVIKQDDDGTTYILAEEGGEEFDVSFDDCEDPVATIGCKLLIFSTSWEPDAAEAGEVANRFNQTARLAHAFVDDEDVLNLTLAVTTKGGLPAENFAAVIASWQAADTALSDMVAGDSEPKPAVVVAALSVR